VSQTLSTVYRTPVAARSAVGFLALFVIGFDLVGTAVAAQSVGAALRVSATELSWVLAAGPLAVAATLLLAGRLGRHGFHAGAALFATGALVAVFADHVAVLLVARPLQGVGAALVLTTVQWRPHVSASLVGVVAGGALVSWFGWQAVFVVDVALMIAVVVAVRPPVRTVAARPPLTDGLLAAGAAGLLVAALLLTAQRVQLLGQSPLRAGLLMAPAVLCLFAGRPLAGPLTRVVGRRTTIHVGFATSALGFWLLAEATTVADLPLLVTGLVTVALSLSAMGLASDVALTPVGIVLGVAVTTVDSPYLVAVLAAAVLSCSVAVPATGRSTTAPGSGTRG